MADPFVAEIRIFPFNFAPRGWAFCSGQILPISQNTALFSLLGTTYGGNGQSNFALPNLQGAAPLGFGQGPGLSLYDLGQTGGTTTVTLGATQIPSHTHTASALPTVPNPTPLLSPSGNIWAVAGTRRVNTNLYATAAGTPQAMNAVALAVTGGGQPHNNMPPYLTMNFCIAMQGVFPPRT